MKRTLKRYSQSFKQQVLDDYYQSGMSQHAFAEKHQIHVNTLNTWINACKNGSKSVSLRSNSIHMDAKDQALENLRMENEKLRREVEYQKLKVAGQGAIYRAEMPIIGGLKLYYLVSSVLGDAMDMGRDKFLCLLHRHKLIIPPRKTHHTTNSNHVYFKYPNLVQNLSVYYVNQVWVSDITYISVLCITFASS